MVVFFGLHDAQAGPASLALKEASELILKKFGRGALGKSAEEIAQATARIAEKHGDEAIPLLRATGHAGLDVLETSGKQAPEVIKLFATRGEDSVWLISQPKKLAIFLRHGDDAADALLKYRGIADDLIERFGSKALTPMLKLKKESVQLMGMAAKEGVFDKTARNQELFVVIEKFGDKAMEFIWKHKGALLVATGLAAFLDNPEPFIQGTKDLAVATLSPLTTGIAQNVNWTLASIVTIAAVASLVFLKRRQAKVCANRNGESN
jgi:hypothetical protein